MKKILLILAIFIVIITNAKETPLLIKTKVLEVIPRIEKGQLWIFNKIKRDIVSGDSILREQPFTKLIKVINLDKKSRNVNPTVLSRAYATGERQRLYWKVVSVTNLKEETYFKERDELVEDYYVYYNKYNNQIVYETYKTINPSTDGFIIFIYIMLFCLTILSLTVPTKGISAVPFLLLSGVFIAIYAHGLISEHFNISSWYMLFVIPVTYLFLFYFITLSSNKRKLKNIHSCIYKEFLTFIPSVFMYTIILYWYTESIYISVKIIEPYVVIFVCVHYLIQILKLHTTKRSFNFLS